MAKEYFWDLFIKNQTITLHITRNFSLTLRCSALSPSLLLSLCLLFMLSSCLKCHHSVQRAVKCWLWQVYESVGAGARDRLLYWRIWHPVRVTGSGLYKRWTASLQYSPNTNTGNWVIITVLRWAFCDNRPLQTTLNKPLSQGVMSKWMSRGENLCEINIGKSQNWV